MRSTNPDIRVIRGVVGLLALALASGVGPTANAQERFSEVSGSYRVSFANPNGPSHYGTRDVEAGTDELTGPEALGEWLVEQRLLPDGSEIDEEAWWQALEIRECLRAHVDNQTRENQPCVPSHRNRSQRRSKYWLASRGPAGDFVDKAVK